ncbi:restriction endonuclease [Candidatus Uhrbacteria bacterium]|nr:restriction endonuclease [Candidatus Uhrbacteria bacterium]
MTDKIMVQKASGELQKFSPEKLRKSLERSGADAILSDEIVEHLSSQMYDGIPTRTIHTRALAMLKSHRGSSAARYNLKRAIFALGPSGFPFEKYVARLFDSMGYTTRVGVILQGKCVTHEVDVVLTKGDVHGFAECKYHNIPGTTCNVKTPLYVFARFEDICEREGKRFKGNQAREGWLVTNTRFTDDALAYGSCAGLKLLGWNTGPLGESLERMIDARGLHPVTCLTSLKKAQAQRLLVAGVVLCQDLFGDRGGLTSLLPTNVLIKASAEAMELCKHPH